MASGQSFQINIFLNNDFRFSPDLQSMLVLGHVEGPLHSLRKARPFHCKWNSGAVPSKWVPYCWSWLLQTLVGLAELQCIPQLGTAVSCRCCLAGHSYFHHSPSLAVRIPMGPDSVVNSKIIVIGQDRILAMQHSICSILFTNLSMNNVSTGSIKASLFKTQKLTRMVRSPSWTNNKIFPISWTGLSHAHLRYMLCVG